MAHALRKSTPGPVYGWSAEGKTPAQIEQDIQQTRYRLNADVEALREKLRPVWLARSAFRAKWPIAAAALAGMLFRFLIRRARR